MRYEHVFQIGIKTSRDVGLGECLAAVVETKAVLGVPRKQPLNQTRSYLKNINTSQNQQVFWIAV